MIKNTFPHIKLWQVIVLFSLVLLGLVSQQFVSNSKTNTDYNLNKVKIENILKEKNLRLKERLNQLTENYKIDTESTQEWFYSQGKDIYIEKETGYFLYDKNNLKFWTTNDISLPTSANINFFNNKIINLPNGWYLCQTNNSEDFFIVGLARIKKDYSYDNHLIKNNFAKDLDLNHDAVISLEEFEGSTKITVDDKGNSFYLSFKTNNSINKVKFSFYNFLCIFNIISITIFILILIFFISNKNKFILLINPILYGVLLIILRYISLKYNYTSSFNEFKLFSPELFAESFWLQSLGDYIINVFLFLSFAFLIFYNYKIELNFKIHSLVKLIFSASLASILFLSGIFISNLIYGLVWNSSLSFSFENILNLDIYSLVGILIIFAIIFSFILIFTKLFRLFKIAINFWVFIISLIICYSLYLIFSHPAKLSFTDNLIFNVLFFLAWSCLAFVILKSKTNYFFTVGIIIIFSFLISEHFSRLSDNKELETFKVLSYNLAAERDVGAEFFIKEAFYDLMYNADLEECIRDKDYEKIENIVNSEFFNKRYFNKYEIQTTICEKKDSLLIEPDLVSVDCFEFFREQINEFGIIIPSTNFYFLDNHNGRISYLGEINSQTKDSSIINVYVELNSKIFSEGLGYPEMLLDEKLLVKKTARHYNHAKYNKSRLISSKGEYKYQFTIDSEQNDSAEYKLFKKDSYIHFQYRPDSENIIIISKPYSQYSKQLVSFSYVFLFLFVSFNLIWLFSKMKSANFWKGISLKVKIQSWFIIIIIVSLLITASIAMSFIVQGYKEKQREIMLDKMHSVVVELEHSIGQKELLNYEEANYLNDLLIKLSNVFYTDINLYDLNGILISTSRSELFDKGLKARYIDVQAYSELLLKNAGTVIIDEKIDEIDYSSVYIPFRNFNNETIAYLNLPYFARQNEFSEEISNFILAFSNIFLILILISVIVGVFISRQLTRPLALVQEKIKLMDINKKAEKIIYHKNDELGGLIREYNRKVDELTESANKLAQSERETAWREMAKQIAHEIKNPLTPMKLSVQHLERAYDLKDENWEETYKKVSKILIEQIDILSTIASEFSNFAKMPASKKEVVNIVEIIKNSIQLFENTEDINFEFKANIKTEGFIYADKEQVLRVFTNLIKNSTQAIPKERKGLILIEISDLEKSYIIKVVDNGTGISKQMIPKIFQPNFTTKSGGMGLGLSMVKSLLISNNATIYFETKENIGTEFIIEIPMYNN
ncbi:MAG: ATP-binding protein [Bacteroidales bacterium]|nr:ATP-binding protein [Bacteroidales bacterium]